MRLAHAGWNDIVAVDGDQESGVGQRQRRHTSYRHYVFWPHGRLGEGSRVVMSCCSV